MVPRTDNFVGDRTFLLLDILGWTKENLGIFQQPYNTWDDDIKYCELIDILRAFYVINDSSER